jgi:hypothetical protein
MLYLTVAEGPNPAEAKPFLVLQDDFAVMAVALQLLQRTAKRPTATPPKGRRAGRP